jgi:hypothetical protein
VRWRFHPAPLLTGATRPQRHVFDPGLGVQFALQGAVGVDVLEVAAADCALRGAHSALWRSRLRSSPEENDLGAVDDVGLDAGDVCQLGNVCQLDDVMVGAASDLQRSGVGVGSDHSGLNLGK